MNQIISNQFPNRSYSIRMSARTNTSLSFVNLGNISTQATMMEHLKPASYVEFCYLALTSLTGITGNALLIGVVFYTPKLRTSANWFVLNVAVADHIITGYVIPVVLANNIVNGQLMGPTLCSLNGCLLAICAGVSISSLQFIAVNRYLAICHKHWYKKIFSKVKTICQICLIWIYVSLGVTPSLYGWGEIKYIKKLNMCAVYHAASLSFSVFMVTIGILLPAMTTLVCYIKIYHVFNKSRKTMAVHSKITGNGKDASKSKQKERQLLVSFVVFVGFTLFWIPYCIAVLADRDDSLPGYWWKTITWIALGNSSINWAIYGFFNSNFRDAYKKVFSCGKNNITPVSRINRNGVILDHF